MPPTPRTPTLQNQAAPARTSRSVALERALEGGARRTSRIILDGQECWLKRREELSLRWRLQKGDPRRAFERERAALQLLGTQGLPVAPLLAQGEDYLVIGDCGASLARMLRSAEIPQEERITAFRAAGRALAQLHLAGIAHGRPSVKDICHRDGRIAFIDFERFVPPPAPASALRNDLLIFVSSAYAFAQHDAPEIAAACSAHRARAPERVWEAAARLCRRLRWIDTLTRPLQRREARRHPSRACKEFGAIPLTLRCFGARDASP